MPRITNNMMELGDHLSSHLLQEARRVNRRLDRVVLTWATRAHALMVELAPVDFGNFRAGFQGPFRVADAVYEIRNNVAHGPVIEVGGYRGVGPKTAERGPELLEGGIAINGGIFPTQKPHAPVRRSLSMIVVELTQSLGDFIEGR